MWGLPQESLPHWLGFHFFFPQASERVWDFPVVASLQQSPAATQAQEALGSKCHRTHPPETRSAFRLLATHAFSAQSYVCFSDSQLPLPCGLWAFLRPLSSDCHSQLTVHDSSCSCAQPDCAPPVFSPRHAVPHISP